MTQSQGFWSYVHKDDEAEGERISQLARDVSKQFEMLTGESLTLFLDKDAIKWGDDWRGKIDSSLTLVAFFIPVLTPRYFMSPECRREMQFFARQATRLGIKELVLPIHYVDVPALQDVAPTDDLVAIAKTFQWEDWRELRFADVKSEAYRRGVSRLASRLVEANRRAEETEVTKQPSELSSDSNESINDAPGFIDQIASIEDALPRMLENIESIGHDIELIGKLMRGATADIPSGSSQSFKSRVSVARRLADQLGAPTDDIWKSGNSFASQLHQVDEGIRAIVENAPSEIQRQPESEEEYCKFLKAVRDLSVASHQGLGALQSMVEAISPIEKLSRDLRPALRRLRQGLTVMIEGREVTDEWVRLIESTGLDCSEKSMEQDRLSA